MVQVYYLNTLLQFVIGDNAPVNVTSHPTRWEGWGFLTSDIDRHVENLTINVGISDKRWGWNVLLNSDKIKQKKMNK